MAGTAGGVEGPSAPEEFCAQAWEGLDDAAYPVWGSATRAHFWVGVEQPGPWGAKALTESRLDPAVGAALEEAVSSAGGRVLLIRAVGDHRGADDGTPHHVFVGGGAAAGEPWLLHARLGDVGALLRLPWEVVAAGAGAVRRAAARDAGMDLTPHPTPVLLVCTNSKRDRCCAIRGRKVAAAAAEERGAAVWECTHTGGHRYAPTGVLLPHGAMFARLDGPLAVRAIDEAAAGRLPAELSIRRQLRGLAHLDEWAQAADAYVRAASGEAAYDALTVEPAVKGAESGDTADTTSAGGERSYLVRHRDGHHWPVTVRATRRPAPPVSCGKPAADQTVYVVSEG